MECDNSQMDGLLTMTEVSQLLRVHSNTLRRWSDRGIIKAYRIGPRRDRKFRAEDIAILIWGPTKAAELTEAKKRRYLDERFRDEI